MNGKNKKDVSDAHSKLVLLIIRCSHLNIDTKEEACFTAKLMKSSS